MTRLAILADIHGNLPALEAVEHDLAQFHVDHVIVAGDVVNWGPFSADVMERVTRNGWATIRGNNEFYLLDYQTARQPTHWEHYALLPWLYEQLQGHWHHVIAAWPDELSLRYPDAPPIRVVHGTPQSNSVSMYPNASETDLETWLTPVAENVIIAGHSHLPMERRVGRWHVLNPGSVGVPLDGIHLAHYMLLETHAGVWHATFREVAFELTPLFAEFERQRFVEQCGVQAHLAVEEFRTARLHILPFLQWKAQHYPEAPIDFDLLPHFTEAQRWAFTPLAYHVNR